VRINPRIPYLQLLCDFKPANFINLTLQNSFTTFLYSTLHH